MECLTSLVGLKNCGESEHPLNLNDIGVSLEQLEQLRDDTYSTVDEWLESAKEFAAERLSTDIISGLSKNITLNTLLENNTVGKFADNMTETTATGLSGIKITLPNSKEYVKLVISSISLFSNYDGDVPVLLIDLRDGQTLATTTITSEAGKVITKAVKIEVKSSQRNLDLALVYDATGITAYKTTLTANGCSNCNRSGNYNTGYATFNMVKLDEPRILSSVSKSKNTAGLSFEYSLQCDQKSWVCNIAPMLGLAMLYKVAYEMFNHSIHSGGQFSNQKVTNFENNEARMTGFEYNYGLELNKVLKNANLPIGACFVCNPKIKILNRRPG